MSRKKTETPSYITVHKRTLKLRGKATGYPCWYSNPRKPHRAAEWAYIGDDPDEQIHKDGPYSYDGNHYVPMCKTHHIRHDQVVNKIMECGCPVRVHMRSGCVALPDELKSLPTASTEGLDGPSE